MHSELYQKYQTRAPRYTSYPTAPHFRALDAQVPERATSRSTGALGVYVHIPFCEKLCLYCGCTVEIQGRREVGGPYVDHVLAELDLWLAMGLVGRSSAQLALGGGTPTFLLDDDLGRLIRGIDARLPPTPDAERSIEIDPRTITEAGLDQLLDLGLGRFSFGVQDFDEAVLAAVKRPQSYGLVAGLVQHLQRRGAGAINLDLMYGLPHQTVASFGRTLDQVIGLRPARLALFLYAHVPWMKPAQKLLDAQLPDLDTRSALAALARDRLTSAGYVPVGMDHFALPDDALVRAQTHGSLHRNFMGYTTQRGRDLLGLGMSAIGLLGGTYLQNYKTRATYQAHIESGQLAVERGHELSVDDARRRDIILDLFCNFTTTLDWAGLDDAKARLGTMQADGLCVITSQTVVVTEAGRPFIRSICGAFDAYLEADPTARRYSQTA